MNQELNPSIPSHMTAQQYQWNAGNPFHSDEVECSLTNVPQSQFSNTTGDNQSPVLLYGGRRYVSES